MFVNRYKMALPFALLLLGGLSGCADKTAAELKQDNARSAAALQRVGAMNIPDFDRVEALRESAENGHRTAASDVDWLLALAARPGTGAQEADRMQWVSFVFADSARSGLPASRLGAIFNFAQRAVSYPNAPEDLQGMGCIIFTKLRDPRAVADLTPLLSSRDGSIRVEARNAIRSLRGKP